VPIAPELVRLLQRYRPTSAKLDDPIFPSANNRPDGAMLEEIAWRRKLNCGHCVNKQKLKDGTVRVNRCAQGPYCNRWFLHKFRHYAESRTIPHRVLSKLGSVSCVDCGK
jgi:integrase/recombinase XerD